MKTIEMIKSDLRELLDKYESYLSAKRLPPKSLCREIAKKKELIAYIETNPTEECIKGQLDRVEKRLCSIRSGFIAWVSDATNQTGNKTITQLRNIYNNLFNVKKLREQEKTLRYLLSL